jgi:hypothetical protein
MTALSAALKHYEQRVAGAFKSGDSSAEQLTHEPGDHPLVKDALGLVQKKLDADASADAEPAEAEAGSTGYPVGP